MTGKGASKNFRLIVLTIFTFVHKHLLRHLLVGKHDLILARFYWFCSHYCSLKQIELNHNIISMLGAIVMYVISKLMYALFKNESFIQICFLVVKLHNNLWSNIQNQSNLLSNTSYIYVCISVMSEVCFDFSMKITMRNF